MRITLIFFVLFFGLVASTCPDGSRCPDDERSTCCRAKNGYSCCPLANAVCCDNGVYCCPSGMSCNLKDGTCVQHLTATPNVTSHHSSHTQNHEEHACPDKKHKCSDDSTCCLISPTLYGCCPYKGAVCCNDHEHCCPPGSTCNLAEARCDLALVHTTPNIHTICPGGEYVCPEESTCCKLKSGGYGCCPLENAICCSDQQHCCPVGYDCKPNGCQKNNTVTSWVDF